VNDFRRGLGSVALDLVATLADRPGARHEKLEQPADLDAWLVGGDLLDRSHATTSDLTDARALRETIWRLVDRSLDGRTPQTADRKTLNEWAVRSPALPQLHSDWRTGSQAAIGVPGALSAVARDAVELLGGSYRERIRRCGRCTLLFVDRSRPGNRRWCSMQTCGNLSKAADFRARHRSGG
jgi:predicted RNA-binding Zn ribbon-like protein